MTHTWLPDPPFELPVSQKSELLMNKDEREPVYCPRCKSTMLIAALGHIPDRIERNIGGTNSDVYSRKITGWETLERAMQRQKITDDCDMVLVAKIMES